MAVIPSRVRGSTVRVTVAGRSYWLGGVGDIVENETDATTESVEDVTGNVISSTSAQPPSTYTLALINYLPTLPEYAEIAKAKKSGDNVQFEFRLPETNLLDDATLRVAIDTSGVATITETGTTKKPDLTSDEFGRGMAFRIGNAYHQVDSIGTGENAKAKVSPAPDSAISATAFKLVIPSSVTRGAAQIAAFSGFGTRTAGGLASSSMTLAPSVDFPHPIAEVPPADFNFNE